MARQYQHVIFYFLLLAALADVPIVAQNPFDGFESGNEWIQPALPHYEFFIEEDGIYDLVLEPSFFKDDAVCNYKIYRLGKEVPSHKSIDNGGMHHILFYGEKNKGQVDAALFEKGDQLNPDFSLFTDKAAYYLVTNTQADCNRLIKYIEPSSVIESDIDYFWQTEKQVFSDFHFKAKIGQNLDLQSSEFDIAQGFGSQLSNDHRFLIRTNNVHAQGPQAILRIRFAGNLEDHDIDILWNGKSVDNIQIPGYGVVERDYNVSTDMLLQTNQLNIRSNNGDLDKLTIASVSLRYPQNAGFISDNNFIELTARESIQALQIDPTKHAVIIDLQSQLLYVAPTQNKIEINPSDTLNQLVIASEPKAIASDELTKVEFADYQVENPSYVILSNETLRSTELTGKDELQAYADYRASEEGGAHDVLIIDVNDLYRQFAFGQQSHPLAIRHFAQYVSDYWQSVEGMFIIGKAIDYHTSRNDDQVRSNSELVPTYGSPGSDNLLLSDEGSIAPLFPIGRLAAQTPTDVKVYLEKIKIHEQQDPSQIDPLWRKKILHLSGGSSDIVDIVATFLKSLEEIIEQTTLGASVETFSKTSSAPIQPTQTKELLTRINDGVSVITFLGHSAPGTFDFSLEEPAAYENEGQLPLIISLGCHSGNIHTEGFGLSEQFVLEPEKGAIAFLASSSSNYLDVQYLVGRVLYSLIGDNFHNEPIGRALQEIFILTDQLGNESLALNEQFTLHGDPLVQLTYSSLPDLKFDESSAVTEPAIITNTMDSFVFSVDIVNAGKAISDDVSVLIKHVNDSDSILYELVEEIQIPSFSNTLSFTLPIAGLAAIGENRIELSIDPENKVNEGAGYAEENNKLINKSGNSGYRFFLVDQTVKAVYPADMSILVSEKQTLKASTSNALAAKDNYVIRLDTTVLFNSPHLMEESITNVFGLMEWSVDLPMDNTVYYWTVEQENQSHFSDIQSFLYSSSSQAGWNQSHFYQYEENDYSGLVLNDSRQLQFDTSGFFISIHNRIYNPAVPPGYQFNFENFASSVNPWLFLDEGIAVVVGDQINGSALLNNGGDFGSVFDISESSKRVFGFKTETTEERESLLKFLEQIPDGQYVFLFTVLQNETANIKSEEWLADQDIIGRDLISYLESQGAVQVRQLSEKGTLPYNFIYQKGTSALGEQIADMSNQSIRTDVFIPTLVVAGDMCTSKIGPASKWHSASLSVLQTDADKLEIVLMGIDTDGIELELKTTTELTFDLADVDASVYPYLKILIKMEDNTQRTAPQLNHLRVFYDGLPDLALDPERHVEFSDGLNGEMNIGVGVTNSSEVDISKSEITYVLSDPNGDYATITKPIPEIAAEGFHEQNLTIETEKIEPNSILTIELNPTDNPKELHHFNNLAIIKIDEVADVTAPLLHVTFDGILIQNGDIISPNPVIVFEVNDQDRINPVNSIQQFNISIRRPDGSVWDVIDSEDLLTLKASQDNLTSRLEFLPSFEEGDYQLTATVFDKAANESNEYQLIFKVVTRKTISNLTAFPNPLREGMKFQYFLTGDLDFSINVYNNEGKLVKHFSQSELTGRGSGRLESAFWDGTDDAGNVLPTGVYTYKIIYDESDFTYQDFLSAFDQKVSGQLIIIR